MARARNIKPGFFRNADLVELSFETRLLFIGLWTIADREGRLEDRPKQIKMELFPADSIDCDKLLDELQSIGVVERYEHGGKRYLHVVNFCKHQNPHKDEKASTIPDKHGNYAEPKQAQYKHRASTVQTPCSSERSTGQIGLIPDSLIPDSLIPEGEPPPPAVEPPNAVAGATPPAKSPKEPTALQDACRNTWAAYSRAYEDRYGVAPVRAAKQNSQVKQVVQALGAEEAPLVAEWFVRHPAQWYVTKGHDIGLLLTDIVKLRTEWATGRVVTSTAARQADRRGAMADTVQKLLRECEQQEGRA